VSDKEEKKHKERVSGLKSAKSKNPRAVKEKAGDL
jgi:hypothetical protein